MIEKNLTQHINTDLSELKKPTDLTGLEDGFIPARAEYLKCKYNLIHEVIAEAVGVSRSTITGYLSGHRIPPIDKIVKMAKVLHTNPEYLMGYSNLEAEDIHDLKDILSSQGLKWGEKEISSHQLKQVNALVDAFCKTSQ
ncbi:hypothetical protein bcgnr5378_05840 [Bacillus cereus]|uniref:HTH cro/C1-type domain-containing protein n=1 Tax=Bacillus cereus TaxID=1396 RepID=A0A164LBR1_BACCE|nr:helix-turn-helix transcriptional regulator [Bacillus cereus]KZD55642.1 hypothetical protein B4088_5387 [Bacillus cereus]